MKNKIHGWAIVLALLVFIVGIYFSGNDEAGDRELATLAENQRIASVMARIQNEKTEPSRKLVGVKDRYETAVEDAKFDQGIVPPGLTLYEEMSLIPLPPLDSNRIGTDIVVPATIRENGK